MTILTARLFKVSSPGRDTQMIVTLLVMGLGYTVSVGASMPIPYY